MGCDGLMITPKESSPHMHLKKKEQKKNFKRAWSHFQEATAQILSWARFLNSMIRKQLLFLIYDHEMAAIKFSYVTFLYKILLQSVMKEQQPIENCI